MSAMLVVSLSRNVERRPAELLSPRQLNRPQATNWGFMALVKGGEGIMRSSEF